MNDPVSGVSKAIGAVIGGAVATILVWLLDRFMPPPPIPPEICAAIQTLITAGIVYLVPHSVMNTIQTSKGNS